MTTLSQAKGRVYEPGSQNTIPVAAATRIFEGAAVGIVTATGYAQPLTSANSFAGFARASVDNRAGAAGAANVDLVTSGGVQIPVTSAVIASIGASVYASDDDTFNLTSGVYIGAVKRFVSAGVVVVAFDVPADSGDIARLARDASGNITGLAGAAGSTLQIGATGGLPPVLTAARNNFSFPRPVTPTAYWKLSDTDMADGSLKSTQTDVVGSRTLTKAGTMRHDWCHVNGNSGTNFNGTNAAYTCTDAAFIPFRADQSWAVEGCFTYPASLRTGSLTEYGVIGSMDATGVVNFQGFMFGLKWNGGSADTTNTMPNGQGGVAGRMIPQVYLVGVLSSNQKYLNVTTWNISSDIPHHFLIVYNASSYPTSSTLELYLDGILVATSTNANPTVSASSNNTPLWIGNRKNSTIWFNGTISDVAIYQNTLLTDAQRYAIAGPGYTPPQSIIYDSPLCNDANQPQDLAIFAQYHKYGLYNLAAVIADGVYEKSPAATRPILSYVGVRARIGAWGGSSASAPDGPPAATSADYTANVATKFPVPAEVSPYAAAAVLRSNFVPSLPQLVYTLAACPNNSVTYWMGGFATALAELFAADNATIVTALTSSWSAGASAAIMNKLVADGSGATPTGATIAKLKIARVVVHGGFYPSSLAIGTGAGEDVANVPEYNFRSDSTRWVALFSALSTAATIKVDYESMAFAPGNVSIGTGVAKAALSTTSNVPLQVAYASLPSSLNTAGERTCYNAWSLADLVYPNQVGNWVPCNDVTVDNTNARASASYNSYGENYMLSTAAKPNRWLAVNQQVAPNIKTMLQTLMNWT